MKNSSFNMAGFSYCILLSILFFYHTSETEMISHPIILLLAVATSDVDPVACMQELASVHHAPQCLISGQYDNDAVQRVYVLVHDTHSKSAMDPRKEYDKVSRTLSLHTYRFSLVIDGNFDAT